ncbi:MAG: late competence development ComFB family protein [Natronospirillum sp.]|uniref:late competence development ComFB family protein n=1 Tax=Natronospirillum sp. TaxID=2812955 RepID=UPI0025FA57B4|nr:late competence development ComFB family protein [Natronospirillum sp.]MCH8551641.1 late competence development ComFB family protein [Natronospirillum sp.]
MSIKEDISNYYEDLVVDHLVDSFSQRGLTREEMEDVACLALNQLPARYYRYSVDMAFFLTGREMEKMRSQVHDAVAAAVEYVISHRNQPED